MKTQLSSRTTNHRSIRAVALVCAIAVLSVLTPSAIAAAAPPGSPNVLFLFADDFTYDAINALRDENDPAEDTIITPNLDALVGAGTTFTHAYNQGAYVAAVCRSSRDMLETGHFIWNAKDNAPSVYESNQMASQLFAANGYDTYFAGKVHMTGVNATNINERYDRVGTIRGSAPTADPLQYNRPIEGEDDPWSPTDPSFGGFWEGGTHWSEVLADEGIDFIRRADRDRDPFYMQLSFSAPHDPRQAPQEYLDLYPLEDIVVPPNYLDEYPYNEVMGAGRSLRDERIAPFPRTEYAVKVHRQEYYAAVTYMDAQIGRILDELDRTGQREETVVVFTGDHGISVGEHGLLGKQNMYEHSMRSMLILDGPGIPANQKNDTRIYYQDAMPTMLDLTNTTIPSWYQFRSLVPILESQRESNYQAIYGAYTTKQRMVIEDDWKLILYADASVAKLFDLNGDPREMVDLYGQFAYDARARSLFSRLLQLQGEVGDDLDLISRYPGLAEGSSQGPFGVDGNEGPGDFEAEDYDVGGFDVAWFDDATNDGTATAYREPGGVDLYSMKDTSGQIIPGYVVGKIEDNEWLEYTIAVPSAGQYDLSAFISSGLAVSNAGSIAVSVDDALVATLGIGTTGDWWSFIERDLTTLSLSSGNHVLRFDFGNDPRFNIDRFRLAPAGIEPTPTAIPPTPIPPTPTPPGECGGLTQEAEAGQLSGNFGIGSDGGASGGQYIVADEGSGNFRAAVDVTHAATYCVAVPASGSYNLTAVALALDSGSDSVYLQVDDQPIVVWHMGQSSIWVERTAKEAGSSTDRVFSLSAGEHTFRIYVREDGARIDEFSFVSTDAVAPTPTVAGPTPTPQPPTGDCGGLAQEAESGLRTGAFIVGTDGGASAGAYVTTPESTGDFYTFNPANAVEFCVRVATSGTYSIDTTVLAPDNESDSMFVQFDDETPKVWHMGVRTSWTDTWVRIPGGNERQIFALGAGDHTLRFYAREDGAELDRFALVLESSDPVGPRTCGATTQEAEVGTVSGVMVIGTGLNASADGFVGTFADAGNFYTLDPNNYVEYCVLIPSAGTWEIDASVLTPDNESDSLYVQVDAGPIETWHMGQWPTWTTRTVRAAGTSGNRQYELAAGEHTLRFYARESNALVDTFSFVQV